MPELFLDIETISTVSVITHGVYAHAADPTLDITMAAWAVDDAPVTLWWDAPTTNSRSMPPAELEALLLRPDVIVWAHNAAYERLVIRAVWDIDIPLERWRDSAAVARWCNLPGALGDLSQYLLGSDAAKLKIDAKVKALWSTMSLPWTKDILPLFNAMGEYCVRDVSSMRDCVRAMPTIPDQVWREYAISEQINDRGVQIDMAFAEAVLPMQRALDDEIQIELAHVMGDPEGSMRSPRSPTIRQWMQARIASHANQTLLNDTGQLTRAFKKRRTDGVGFTSEVKATFDKGMRATVREFMAEAADHIALDVLDLVDEGQNAAITKYKAAVNRSVNNRLQGMYMFSGASQTHRYSSTGVQLHNLLRETLPLDVDYDLRQAVASARLTPAGLLRTLPPDLRPQGLGKALSKALRSTIMATPGNDLIWSDWSAIEARVLPWLAYDDRKLRMFEAGVDVYKANATNLFGVPLEDVTKEFRQAGKVQELALGFGGGKGAFAAMSRGYGVKLTPGMVDRAVQSWRADNPVITNFWKLAERAAFDAMRESNWRKPFQAGRIQYIFAPDICFGSLLAFLPDGTALTYPRARIELVTRFEDQPQEAAICFDHPVFGRTSLWFGTLVENATQACAASLLRSAILRAVERGLDVVGHVHDEILCEAPLDQSDEVLAALPALMCEVPDWAEGLPLDAEAGRGSRYKIDDSAY